MRFTMSTLSSWTTAQYPKDIFGPTMNVTAQPHSFPAQPMGGNHSSDNALGDGIWAMPREMFVVTMAILTSEILLSLLTNIVLIGTIWHSPSLKTPPNAHLVNICVNNIMLTICMIFSAASLLASGFVLDNPGMRLCNGLQNFFTSTCFFQYWSIFASIGFYRCRTIKNATMPLQHRRRIIYRSIAVAWVVSVTLGLSLTLAFKDSTSTVSWNSFRRMINETEIEQLKSPTSGHIFLLYLILLFMLICSVFVGRSYYWILKALYSVIPVCRARVGPWPRTNSVSSEDNEVRSGGGRSYRPDETPTTRGSSPFTISSGTLTSNFVVHYQKRTQSITVDDVFALEYPIRANVSCTRAHKTLQKSMSNGSRTSTKSVRNQAFTDISPGAELQRLQRMKNTYALRNQSWRKDRVSLRSATKNSLVMLVTFFLCSLPLLICSMPSILPITHIHGLSSALLFCHLAFFMNAPAYPIWYLIFSKRVRKCLQRLYFQRTRP